MSPNPQFAQQQQTPMGMSPPPDANGRMTPQTPQFPMGNQMAGQMQNPMAGQIPGQMGGQMGMAMPSQMVGQMQSQMAAQMAGQMGQQLNPQMAAAFPGGQIPPGFNPNFAQMQGMNMAGQQGGFATPVNLSPNIAAQQAQIQRDYQMKMQAAVAQQQQMANMQRQGLQQAAMNRMMGGQQPTMGTPSRPPQPPNPQLQAQAQHFIKQVQAFAMRSGRPFDPNPTLLGRPVNLFTLFRLVVQNRGSKQVTNMNLWPKTATALNFHEPNAGPELKEVFERTLGAYEAAYWQNQKQKSMEGAAQGVTPGMPGGQMSPTRSAPQTPQSATPQQGQMMPNRMSSIPSEQMTPVQANASIAMQNGWATPQMDTPSMKAQNLPSAQRKSISRPPDGSPAQTRQSPTASSKPHEVPKMTNGAVAIPQAQVVEAHYDEKCYLYGKVPQDSNYGGIAVDALFSIGHDITVVKPLVPDPADMGLIDIRAISLSLQSGIRSEVRYALDVLIKMTGSAQVALELDQCEDLVDILIDCAEEQVDILQKDAPDLSETVDLASYEDVVRNARLELLTVQDLPEAGTPAYEADRAAERLLAITTILRNLSFPVVPIDKNASFIAHNSTLIKFISSTIRLIGTRNMLLRTHFRTQDFMKDIVIFLSNTASEIKLPSKEDGINLLHFLLAFAPNPNPASLTDLRFSFYHPRTHRYYPPAIDSLAKLMLTDDPNRTYFKSIFADPSLSHGSHSRPSDSSSLSTATPKIHHQYALLTRAFGLAVAVLPDRTGIHLPDERLGQVREATLSQGLLAADVLSGLLPPSLDAGPALARAWLSNGDCWVPSLVNFCRSVFNNPDIRNQEQWRSIVNRGLNILRRLGITGLGKTVRKGKVLPAPSSAAAVAVAPPHTDIPPLQNGQPGDATENKSDATHEKDKMTVPINGSLMKAAEGKNWDAFINTDVLPNWSFVMGALNMNNMDPAILRNLVALASLDD